MKFLKGLALTLLSFLLFLSLSIFSLVFLLNSTILNPDFITSELDRLEVSPLAEEIISQQPGEEELKATLINTITKLEPVVKEQVSAATYSVYDYLLGKRESPDLAHTLRDTFLSSDFVTSLVDELDITSLAGEFLREQLTGEIPEETGGLADYLDEHLDDIIAELEPWVKEQISAAADPIADYLLGESQSLHIAIPLEPIKEILEDALKEDILQSPPPELAGLPPAMIEQYLDEFVGEFTEVIPATLEIDETVLGTELPAQIATAIAEAEKGLEQVREVISYLQLGYNALIGFMLLLILGIVLIHRQVKGATRGLGITFLCYAVPLCVGIFVAKYFAEMQLAQLPPMPAQLQAWLLQSLNNFLAPLQMLSIGLIAGGVALLIVSFVYPKWRQPV